LDSNGDVRTITERHFNSKTRLISVCCSQAAFVRYKEAVTLGLDSLKYFVRYDDTGAIAGQEQEDIYNSRPLPYIIGEGLACVAALRSPCLTHACACTRKQCLLRDGRCGAER
jgi:hypothetical protein